MLSKRVGIVLFAWCAVAIGWTGCSPKKQTELVAGVSTQVRVPEDLKEIRVDVDFGGVNAFCRAYPVVNGIARLPKTLGVVAGSVTNEPVTIRVSGYTVTDDDPRAPQLFSDCVDIRAQVNATPGTNFGPTDPRQSRVLRVSRQPYLQDKILLVPMPLRYSCFEVDCSAEGPDKTCKAGKCVDPDVDPSTLPEYKDELVFGNSSTCFSPSTCLIDALPPIEVPGKDCTYALVGTEGGDAAALPGGTALKTNGSGLNVKVWYDGGDVSEVLDLDPDEGFTIPDPAHPQQFKLADGLCHPGPLTQHMIVGMAASGLCKPKTWVQPICDNESPAQGADAGVTNSLLNADGGCNPVRTTLAPTASALVVLYDKSNSMTDFIGKQALNEALGFSLTDPALRTTYVGLKTMPDSQAQNDCTATPNSFDALDVPLRPAKSAQTAIAQFLGTLQPLPNNPPHYFDATLDFDRGVYKTLRDLAPPSGNSFNQRAIVVVSNRAYADATLCPGSNASTAANEAQRARTEAGILTYAILVDDKDATQRQSQEPAASNVASAGGTSLYDLYTDPSAGGKAFSDIISTLTSCLYDVPGTVKLSTNAYLSYFSPFEVRTVQLGYGCANGKGWELDSQGRVSICPSACTDLRNAISATNAASFATSQALKEIQITAIDCGGNPAPKSPADAGGGDGSVSPSDASQSTDAPGGGDGGSGDSGVVEAG
jgi:hypothetical protein